MNSRQKGKRGELELSHLLQAYGYKTRRGQQYSGSNGDADVVGIPGLHIECKRVEALNLYSAMEQSEKDHRPGEVPVVMHRKNGKPWLVTMTLEDFIQVWRAGHERENH
jgi:Holliday junction resolvase